MNINLPNEGQVESIAVFKAFLETTAKDISATISDYYLADNGLKITDRLAGTDFHRIIMEDENFKFQRFEYKRILDDGDIIGLAFYFDMILEDIIKDRDLDKLSENLGIIKSSIDAWRPILTPKVYVLLDQEAKGIADFSDELEKQGASLDDNIDLFVMFFEKHTIIYRFLIHMGLFHYGEVFCERFDNELEKGQDMNVSVFIKFLLKANSGTSTPYGSMRYSINKSLLKLALRQNYILDMKDIYK